MLPLELNSQAAAVTGDKINLRGCLTLPVMMRRTKVEVPCYIVPSTGNVSQIILGRNFFNTYKVNLNFANATMQLPDEPDIPLLGSITLDQSIKILLDKTYDIKSHSETLILVPINNAAPENQEGLVQASPTLGYRHKLLIADADGLVWVQSDKIPIKFINLQPHIVTIKAGAEIAVLSPFPIVKELEVIKDGDELINAPQSYHPVTTTVPDKQEQTPMEVIDLTNVEISDSQRQQLHDLLKSNEDLFALQLSDLGLCNLGEHDIDFKGDKPIGWYAPK
jgi:dUTPase